MKMLLTLCLLLMCFSVLVRSQGDTAGEIKVSPSSGGLKVTCPTSYHINKVGDAVSSIDIEYQDKNTGEYQCKNDDVDDIKFIKIFVKFRTCDNCIELDPGSFSGLIVGDLVATFVICVSVYLIAKQAQSGTTASPKKGSDRLHLVPNEISNNDHYQPLRPRNGQRDVYDQLRK